MRVEESNCETQVSRSLAAEDLKLGDFVSVLYETLEFPSFWWTRDPQVLPPGEPVRMHCYSSEGGIPLKVKAICLPFVFVKKPCGEYRTLDLRQHRLVRLSTEYARPVWKIMSRQAQPAVGTSL